MRLFLALVVLVALSSFARADQGTSMPGQVAVRNESFQQTGARQQGADDVVTQRPELEVSSELVFLTSRAQMIGVPELYFTDVGLWRTHVAITPLPRLRVNAGVELLAKQP